LRGLWKKAPADFDTLSPIETVRRAARQLDGEDRLLVVFDQLEEFFILRASLLGTERTLGSEAVPSVADEFAGLRDFLQAFLADPPERVAFLLSYREDHRRLLAPLDLPLRQEGVNWMTVDPFDFSAAANFLRSCPGLTVPNVRMDQVLREAARQEGGRVVMRPIVANLLGVVLRRMADHPTLWRQKSDLLRGYVRDCLGKEMKEERAGLLRALVTDFHTARPRSVADIARETGLEASVLDAQLEHFGRAGLLRCLNLEEQLPARRVWQIAHDFLATLIERVLDGIQRTLWRTLRAWLAPGAVCLALIVFLVLPWIQRHRDISWLANAGFTWNEAASAIMVGTSEGRRTGKWDHFFVILHRMKPHILGLSQCEGLQDVDGLKGLTSLQSLNLNWCNGLRNVDGLKDLTSLQELHLRACPPLQNVEILKDLTSLQSLDLNDCKALRNVDGLKGLTSLKSLDLGFCKALRNVDGLKGLTSLQGLDLSFCEALQNLDGLKGLTSLQGLDLSFCEALQNLDGLKGLPSLKHLNLNGCNALQEGSLPALILSSPTIEVIQPRG
jgi:hypothetical protein